MYGSTDLSRSLPNRGYFVSVIVLRYRFRSCYDNGMTETKTTEESTGCRFPVAPDKLCGRPTVPATGDENGRGRPSAYCDDPAHNRAAAWRARKALESRQTGKAEPEGGAAMVRPVSTAGARAGQYLEEVRALAERLGAGQQLLLRELATLGDPDAAAVQLETVTAEAEQQVAEERARAARAEQARREDREQKEEADAAAAEAVTELQRVTGELGEVRAQLAERSEELAGARAEITEQAGQLEAAARREAEVRAELDETVADKRYLADENERQARALEEREAQLSRLREELAGQQRRADDAERERERIEQQLLGERTRADHAERAIERAQGETAALQTQLTEERTVSRAAQQAAADAREQLAGLVAQLEAAKGALAAEQNHANQRIADQERRFESQLADLRTTITQLRQKHPRD